MKRSTMSAWFRLLGLVVALGAFSVSALNSFIAYAQDSGGAHALQFIRDAEIENYVRALASPIYNAADVDPDSVTIAIVQDSAVNAFVAEGMNEFFYTGLLQMTETPEQLAGVIAHETGHISGGHLIRGKEEMRNASAQAILGMIIAVAAGAASGNGGAAASAALGSEQLAMRGYLSFSRTQEASADVAGMSFLDRAGYTSRGLMEFFDKLHEQEYLPTERQAAYMRTHPMTQSRIDAVHNHLNASPLKDAKLPQKFYDMHERMKAKLLGFLQPETALLRYTENDQRLFARYAYAIALYRTGKTEQSLGAVDKLIKQEPENPYFYELKAQILFENGRVKESLDPYKKANTILPNSALLHESYGHALLETRDPSLLDTAISTLTEANRLEPHTPSVWRFLAAAWGRKGEITKDKQFEGMATYALAEEAIARGADKEGEQLADRAMGNLPKNSTYWLRAQDIKLSVSTSEASKK